ncbi:hypothetical protein [Prescottella agglutinans]|uniref:hypothetical protein n=1 Tax=Prescottella agglutinans TaxID=1644129 RepID=UPI002475B63F|nr:hypothetical protein [Prescottella agglutinans]
MDLQVRKAIVVPGDSRADDAGRATVPEDLGTGLLLAPLEERAVSAHGDCAFTIGAVL